MLKQLKNHQGFMKYFKNTSWLFAEKILRIIVGLLVGIWVARYLGPEQYGIFSYVGAFIGLFTPLGKLGFDGILQREIAKNEKDINQLINSAIFFKLLGNFCIIIFTSLYMYLQNKSEIYIYITLILSSVYLFKSFEVIEFYFRAKVKAKYISISNSIAMVVSALLKVVFIYFKISLVYFALANLIEVIIAIILVYIFFTKEPYKLNKNYIKIKEGISLIKESWPLIFSGFFALIYLNIDQVMIEEMLNPYEVGQYSAAVRISSAFYFIPLTIGWSIQTAIVNAKKQSEEMYYERLQQLFTLTSVLAYSIVLPITYFSSDIINLLFGDKYSEAGVVLAIHIWAALFLFSNVARGAWILNESYLKFTLFANIGAGVLNIYLNYIWLEKYGIVGAAWATLISYSFTYLFSGIFFKPIRKIFWMQLKAMLLIDLIKQIKRLKKGIK